MGVVFKDEIMKRSYGMHTVSMTVAASDFARDVETLKPIFQDLRTNGTTMRLLFSGNSEQLLKAANAGIYGVKEIEVLNNNSADASVRKRIVGLISNIGANRPLAAD